MPTRQAASGVDCDAGHVFTFLGSGNLPKRKAQAVIGSVLRYSKKRR